MRSCVRRVGTATVSPIAWRSYASTSSLTSPAEKEKRKRLPVSPHVAIFKFPLPAMVSITTRFTGVGLSAGVAATGLACLLGDPASLPLWIDGFKSSAPVLVPVAKAVVAFPFVFHTVSGVRHLVWDATAKGFDLKSVNASSWAIIAISAVGTLGLAAYSLD